MAGRRPLLLAGLALLAGCGFRPLLREPDGADVREALAAIEVAGLSGRLGQILRTSLQDELNPVGIEVPARYQLLVRLSRKTDALAIQLDNTITRFNLTLTARFQLRDKTDNRVLYASSVQRIASYNVRRAPYATLVAELDAEQRAAEEMGTNIRSMLVIHFVRTPTTA